MQGITRRDGGVKADPAHLFLTNGASQAVHFMMRLLIRDESDAVLVPIPQYPLVGLSVPKFDDLQFKLLPSLIACTSNRGQHCV